MKAELITDAWLASDFEELLNALTDAMRITRLGVRPRLDPRHTRTSEVFENGVQLFFLDACVDSVFWPPNPHPGQHVLIRLAAQGCSGAPPRSAVRRAAAL